MELKYTPRTIKEIEDVSKKPMVETISDYSMKTMVLFIRKGLEVDEDKAYTAIEKYLAVDGNDMLSLYFMILEKLQELGFIPKSVNIKEMKKKVSNIEV